MDSLVRVCDYCDTTFEITSLRSWAARYCKESCQRAAKSHRQNVRRRGELVPKACAGCDQVFAPNNTKHRYCTNRCRQGTVERARSKRTAEMRAKKQCAHCLGPLGATRTGTAIYCGKCANPSARKKPKYCQECGVRLEGLLRTFCEDCKEATKYARGRAAVYNITLSEYRNLVERKACDICDVALVERRANGSSFAEVGHIDHDHITGKVRGYLCRFCNHMIGNAKDNPRVLRKGAQYLESIGGDE